MEILYNMSIAKIKVIIHKGHKSSCPNSFLFRKFKRGGFECIIFGKHVSKQKQKGAPVPIGLLVEI